MKKVKKIALAGILTALSVVILFLGSVIETLDMSVAAIASFVTMLAVIELGAYFPFLIYAAVCVLAFLLLPNKYGVLIYCLFYGFYPMVKQKLEASIKPRFLLLFIKLVIFAASQTAVELLWVFLFAGGAFEASFPIIAATVALALITFVVFDFALSYLSMAYKLKWRNYIKKYL